MTTNDSRFVGAKFHLGRLLQTSRAQAALSPEDVLTALKRHATGDWGELDPEDSQANEGALVEGERLVSVYRSAGDLRFYVITEWDRSVTTVLLPEDY
jgi:hypothetical protein